MKAGNKQSKKSKEIRERKNKTKGKQSKSKRRSKKFVNATFERKGFIQSFKSRDEILKLKIKIKNIK